MTVNSTVDDLSEVPPLATTLWRPLDVAATVPEQLKVPVAVVTWVHSVAVDVEDLA